MSCFDLICTVGGRGRLTTYFEVLYVVRHGVYWGPGESREGSEKGAAPGCAMCRLCGHPPPDEGAPVADEGAGPAGEGAGAVADERAAPNNDSCAAPVDNGAPASEVEAASDAMEAV